MPDFAQTTFAAWLQNLVAQRREESGLYKEIAEQLPAIDTGRLLDVGTGSGLQLRVIHELHPGLELNGLDQSETAIRVARKNLAGLGVDLRVGSIEHAPYEAGFFDIVTCHSSMSYWVNPIAGLDEIYRILKPGGCGVLFEPQRDIDIDEVVAIIRKNLAEKSRLRQFLAVNLNRFGLQRGRTLGLKLYAVEEFEAIAQDSKFGSSHSIERIQLQNLPIFARIVLEKPHQKISVSNHSK